MSFNESFPVAELTRNRVNAQHRIYICVMYIAHYITLI